MFASIRNFLYRHKRKFYISGGIIGGIWLASKYAEYKMIEWHKKQTHSVIEKQKRRQHYEKTRQTANATALNLSSSITKIVLDELEVDELLQSIRRKPANKVMFWDDLKIQGFSRCVATIYCSVLVGSVVHVKLMLLGGYSFGDTKLQGKEITKVTPESQEKYLSHLQRFIENGLPSLVNKIRKATVLRIKSLSLGQSLTLEQLEGIIKDITLLLAGEVSSNSDNSTGSNYTLQPWSRYVTESNIPRSGNPKDVLYYKMTDELIDVLDSDDFNVVVQNLIQHGINHVLDYIADFYPHPVVADEQTNGTSTPTVGKEDTIIKEAELEISDKEAVPIKNVSLFNKASLPVAKLTPILSDLVTPCLSPAPGHLLQFVLLNEELENLCFNIYEAFSVAI